MGGGAMMSKNLPRRTFLHLAAGAAALPAVSRFASAQAYPTRPVRLLVGFPAGNAPDIVARLMGQALAERLGQAVVIENRPGAASNIATEAAATASPDGYTLLLSVLTNAINATLYTSARYDFLRDIAPVAGIANAPFVLVVTLSFPAKTVPEFIAYAKAKPGLVNMASGGNGTSTHIFGELLKMTAGIDLVHVPYRSSYMPDVLSGQIHMVVAPIPQAMEHIRSGQVRALGVTTAKRLPSLPDVPAIGEFVAGYEAIGWYGLSAPAGMPAEVVQKLNAATNAALADAKVKGQLGDMGVEPMPMTPAEFGKFVAADVDKWAKVIKFAGITPA